MIAHTFFSASPFKPKGYDQAMTPAHQLGLRIDDLFDFVGDFLGVEDINATAVSDLLKGLDDIIEVLPLGRVRDGFVARRTGCMGESNIVTKYTCLYNLAQDVRREVRDGDGGDPAPTPTPTPTGPPAPSADAFPWVPVGIAAGISTAALVYLVLRKKA